jgi:hypothetical protein
MSPPRLWPLTDCTTKYRPVLSSESPSVEAGKNTSTVIPASRKKRRKGNPVVSGETVMYGYESSATLTTDRLHYKLQTRSLVREGAPLKQDRKFQTATFRQEVISGRKSHKGARHQDILTDWPSVVKQPRTYTRSPTIHNEGFPRVTPALCTHFGMLRGMIHDRLLSNPLQFCLIFNHLTILRWHLLKTTLKVAVLISFSSDDSNLDETCL